eukprot:364444-Chlamydomonas_euryale.AAC.22
MLQDVACGGRRADRVLNASIGILLVDPGEQSTRPVTADLDANPGAVLVDPSACACASAGTAISTRASGGNTNAGTNMPSRSSESEGGPGSGAGGSHVVTLNAAHAGRASCDEGCAEARAGGAMAEGALHSTSTAPPTAVGTRVAAGNTSRMSAAVGTGGMPAAGNAQWLVLSWNDVKHLSSAAADGDGFGGGSTEG